MALSPTLILDNHLYLSDVNFAQDEVSVEKHKIDIIVNASSEKYAIPEGVKYVQFELVDEDRAPIESYFEPAFAIFNEALANNQRVLVHCRAGVSRSATIVIAYLMAHMGWTLRESMQYVRTRRPIVCPNHGFMQKLADLDELLFGAKSFDIDDYYVSVLTAEGFDSAQCRRVLVESKGDIDVALFKLLRTRRMMGAY